MRVAGQSLDGALTGIQDASLRLRHGDGVRMRVHQVLDFDENGAAESIHGGLPDVLQEREDDAVIMPRPRFILGVGLLSRD